MQSLEMENLQFVKHMKDDDKSSIWQYFLKEKKGGHAKCKNCCKVIKTSGGSTSGLHTHMKTIHNINTLKRDVPVHTTSADAEPSVEGPPTTITKYFKTTNNSCISVVLSRMCAYDGLPFKIFITSEDLRKAIQAMRIGELPKSANTIRKIIIDYSNQIRYLFVKALAEQKKNKIGFSLTFDEWSSVKNHRYMNINIHSENKVWNLGLIRMFGSVPATKCVEVVDTKLKEFGLSLKNDIVCITTDGAAVMKKVGTLISADQQLCFVHGIHLAVIKILYKKSTAFENVANIENEVELESDTNWESNGESEDEFEDEDIENDNGLTIELQQNNILEINHYELAPLIKKVRKIVKIFRRSPTKNDKVLQHYVKAEFGKELVLFLDCKTRWNSLFSMLERFYMLKSCIQKSIIDLKLDSFSDEEFEAISVAISALHPVKLAVEALCRKDSNLISADTTFKFLFDELGKINSTLSNELLIALKERIYERRTELSGVIHYLHNAFEEEVSTTVQSNVQFNFPKLNKTAILKSLVSIATRMQLFKQKYIQQINDDSDTDQDEVVEIDNECGNIMTMKQKLDEAISKQANYIIAGKKTHTFQDNIKLIKREMTLFEDEGTRGIYIQQIYDLLLTIRPTSAESERAFSAAGQICTKIRSNLNDKSLDALCFLRAYFQSLN